MSSKKHFHVWGPLLLCAAVAAVGGCLGRLALLKHCYAQNGYLMVIMAGHTWRVLLGGLFWLQTALCALLLALALGWRSWEGARGGGAARQGAQYVIARLLFYFAALWLTLLLTLTQSGLTLGMEPAVIMRISGALAAVGVWLIERWPAWPALRAALRLPRGSGRWLWRVGVFAAGGALAMAAAAHIFHWNLVVSDAQSQTAQARLLARGLFAWHVPAALRPVIDFPLSVPRNPAFSHFPAGYIAPLALAFFLRLPLHGFDFLLSGALFLLTARLAARLAPPGARGAARALCLLFMAGSPFMWLMNGSMMNHPWTALMLLGSALCAFSAGEALRHGRPAARPLFGWGLCLAWACATRPLTGAAHVFVWSLVALFFAWRWLRPAAMGEAATATARGWPRLMRLALPAALGFALPMLGLMFYNLKTTGNPFVLQYKLSDPVLHRLGFSPDERGVPFTPLIALQRQFANLFDMNYFLLGWMFGSWPPLAVALLRFRRRPRLALLLALAAAQTAAYAFYHGYDLFFGPRFLYELVPLLLAAGAAAIAPAVNACGAGRGGRRNKTGRLLFVMLALLCAASAWSALYELQTRYARIVSNHDNFREFMEKNRNVRPAVVVIPAGYSEAAGLYSPPPPGEQLWIVPSDKAAQAHGLPELRGYHWLAP